MSTAQRRMGVWCTTSLIGLLACGPIRSTTQGIHATAELSAAKTANAESEAPYEWAAANEFLRKSREELSYANFESAENLARIARRCAMAAKRLALKEANVVRGACLLETKPTVQPQAAGTKTATASSEKPRATPNAKGEPKEDRAPTKLTPNPVPPSHVFPEGDESSEPQR